LSILGNFGIGALAAWMMFYKNGFHQFIKNLERKYIFIFYAIFIPIVYFYFNWAQSQWGIALEKIIFSFLFAFIILEQAFANKPSFALGKSKWVNYLGRISLGLYCYHGVVITFYRQAVERLALEQTSFQVFIMNPMLILFLTIGVAVLSYEVFEKHIHGLRRKFYA
jgi:peptidoglycan/LPS O-acetylase OafA/YrhL